MIWIDNVKGGFVLDDNADVIGRVIDMRIEANSYGYGSEAILRLEIHIPSIYDANELWREAMGK